MYMKQLAIILIFLSGFYSAALGNGNLAIIKIKLNNDVSAGKIILYKTIEGNKVEYASVLNNKDKELAFAVPVSKEGFYYLSDQTGWWFVRIFLKPSDYLELSINNSGMYEMLKGSPENKLLHEWFLNISKVVMPSYNRSGNTSYQSFYLMVNETLKSSAGFRKIKQTTNQKFNRLFNLIMDVEVEHAALLYSMSPHAVQPPLDTLQSFLRKFVRGPKYCDAGLLELGEGVSLLNLYATANYLLGTDKKPYNLEENCNLLCNDTLKGAYIISRFSSYKFYDDFMSVVNPLKKFMVTDHQKMLFDEKLNSLDSILSKGRTSYNFSFPDTMGNLVTMRDIRGKVVLIDAWATWCKPCREDIPYLQELEKEFGEKNVAFVSISFDEIKDKDKWKKFVRDERLTGIQLFANGFKNKMGEIYKISGIPRFMVFDQEGKIVNIDAPRPSDPQLKNLLEGLLTKQK